jgi:hypothetical protein
LAEFLLELERDAKDVFFVPEKEDGRDEEKDTFSGTLFVSDTPLDIDILVDVRYSNHTFTCISRMIGIASSSRLKATPATPRRLQRI